MIRRVLILGGLLAPGTIGYLIAAYCNAVGIAIFPDYARDALPWGFFFFGEGLLPLIAGLFLLYAAAENCIRNSHGHV